MVLEEIYLTIARNPLQHNQPIIHEELQAHKLQETQIQGHIVVLIGIIVLRQNQALHLLGEVILKTPLKKQVQLLQTAIIIEGLQTVQIIARPEVLQVTNLIILLHLLGLVQYQDLQVHQVHLAEVLHQVLLAEAHQVEALLAEEPLDAIKNS